MKGLPAPETFSGRSAYVREVCATFAFRDPRGALQEASCYAALKALERKGEIRLPPPGTPISGPRTPLGANDPVAPPAHVPDRVDRITGLFIRKVETDADRRVFNAMMHQEHPQGAGHHVGRQLRFLIGSEHGWLGGCLFAASALALGARDRWIGWDPALREAHVDRIVGLSRFLIRPSLRCANLASKSLGLCLGRLAADYESRYGVVPLLAETFVSQDYGGISLRAANWIYVGETAGRGRRAATGERVPPKDIWMYPLHCDWRTQLGVGAGTRPPPAPVWSLGPGDGLDSVNWAHMEFGGAPVGNAAMTKRLVKSAAIQATAPMKTFFSAACGDEAAVKGYYRMIDRPDESALTPEAMLAIHRDRTLRRMRKQPTVLCIQDGTDLNFATHHGCVGLGIISKNKGSSGTLGLHMHATFAVNHEGIPLGVPRIEFDAPDGTSDRKKPVEEKKSQRWLRSWRDSSALARALKTTRVIAVMDRESDIVDLFCAWRDEGGADLIVRARHDRILDEDETLFKAIRAQPVRERYQVKVDRASARKAARGQKAFSGRDARTADVELRWDRVDIPVPVRKRTRLGRDPVAMTMIHVHEPHAPKGVDRLDWYLLTTLPVKSVRQARDVIDFYGLRWRIEDWHRILKSGCDVEKIAHQTAERVKRAVTINAIIAWRLATLTLLGRETPELPAETMYSKVEIAALCDFAITRGLPLPPEPPVPDHVSLDSDEAWQLPALTLGGALLLIARLGGYLNRKNDPAPGHQVVWEGYARLSMGSQTLERMFENREQSPAFDRLTQLIND